MKVIKNFLRFKFLLIELVKKNIKLKYRRSYLGLFWTLLEPIFTTLVLNFVFGQLLNRGKDKTFIIYILIGRLMYSFFASSTKMAMRSIRSNASMIKKVYVPKYIYPVSGVISNYIIFLLSLIVLVGACIVKRVPPTWQTLQIILPLIILFMLSLGVGMILASLSVFFRDLEYLWDIACMLIMYCCAIFYTVDPVKQPSLYQVLKFNPLYGIIFNTRQAVIYHEVLDTFSICYAFGFSVIVLALGLFTFKKLQDKFILYI